MDEMLTDDEIVRFERGAHKALICEIAGRIAAALASGGGTPESIGIRSAEIAFTIEKEYDIKYPPKD